MPNLNNLTTQDLQWGTANWSGQGYIDGLQMQWVSGTAITVTSGAAFIPSLNKCLPVPNAIALTGLVLTASTFYHLYLYNNAGVPAVECVTTAPAAPYSGTARAKTGDTSRRYVGSMLTDASGNVYAFQHHGSRVSYQTSVSAAPFRILSGGAATTQTIVSSSAVVPSTSFLAQLRVQNNGTGALNIGPGIPFSLAVTGGPGTASPPGLPWFVDLATGSDQSIVYYVVSGGQVYLDVLGYVYER